MEINMGEKIWDTQIGRRKIKNPRKYIGIDYMEPCNKKQRADKKPQLLGNQGRGQRKLLVRGLAAWRKIIQQARSSGTIPKYK